MLGKKKEILMQKRRRDKLGVGRTGVSRRKQNKMGSAVQVFGVLEVSMRAPRVGKLGLQGDRMCQRDAKRRGGSTPMAYSSVLPFFETV